MKIFECLCLWYDSIFKWNGKFLWSDGLCVRVFMTYSRDYKIASFRVFVLVIYRDVDFAGVIFK